ncbi:hypothetical protein P7K49_038323 [Saguinus oedipus]|uniref:Uncharacterized protein n=1 Tax=Saguinus oedipus TaxID=9490 RepID=A0ABQ9TEC3_SAGOE|nr:hypothetical protein P7K49_038323 [Saguinus oedipus]
MFRGLSSWLGLQQPAAGGGQPKGEGQPSETVAESAEEELQPAGDHELLHQAKDFGSESPPALGLGSRAHSSSGTPLGRGPNWLRDKGAGREAGAEDVAVGQPFPGRERLQSGPVPEVPGDKSLKSLQTLESDTRSSNVTRCLQV